jgi:ribosomal protein S4
LRYNLKIPANIEFRLDVLLFRSAFMNPKNSFYVNKLLRSGKIMVNSKVETNGSRTLVPGD